MSPAELDTWFVEEVLPLEASLTGFLRKNWRVESELVDLRQDVYVRVCEAASRERPASTAAFVFAVARNLLIDQARRARVVSIETVADLDELNTNVDELTPERHAAGRAELQALQLALEQLPPGCRRVVEMRKVQELSQRDVASVLGIAEDTVERQVANGMRALANALLTKGISLNAKAFGSARNRKGQTQ